MKYKPFHPPHIYLDDTQYCLTASTFDAYPFFQHDERKRLLRHLLRKKIRQYEIKLYAWVIISNHYHLLVRIGRKEALWRFIKSLHGESGILENVLDGSEGRKIWRNYWDRFPRSQEDFFTFLNYIHINPIKHKEVSLAERVVSDDGEQWVFAPDQMDDFHDVLASYPFSSYPYYLKKYGKDGMTSVWLNYPLKVDVEWDPF